MFAIRIEIEAKIITNSAWRFSKKDTLIPTPDDVHLAFIIFKTSAQPSSLKVRKFYSRTVVTETIVNCSYYYRRRPSKDLGYDYGA